MSFQTFNINKSPMTTGALERSFAGVRSDVLDEMVFPTERLCANGAREGPFSRMRSDVAL